MSTTTTTSGRGDRTWLVAVAASLWGISSLWRGPLAYGQATAVRTGVLLPSTLSRARPAPGPPSPAPWRAAPAGGLIISAIRVVLCPFLRRVDASMFVNPAN